MLSYMFSRFRSNSSTFLLQNDEIWIEGKRDNGNDVIANRISYGEAGEFA